LFNGKCYKIGKTKQKTNFLSEDSMLRNTKGFTLIELMVVILIIGILAALAIPKFTNAATKAKFAEAPTVIAAWQNAQLARIAETGAAGQLTELVFDSPNNAETKWLDYRERAGSAANNRMYEAWANPNPIGDFAAGDDIGARALDNGTITHHSSNLAVVEKMAPNFGAAAW
jgi:prepilin-type N-terminal cleavage/methylation domain-containing protein